MALSQSRDRLEVMVLEAHGLLAVEGGHGPYARAAHISTDNPTRCCYSAPS